MVLKAAKRAGIPNWDLADAIQDFIVEVVLPWKGDARKLPAAAHRFCWMRRHDHHKRAVRDEERARVLRQRRNVEPDHAAWCDLRADVRRLFPPHTLDGAVIVGLARGYKQYEVGNMLDETPTTVNRVVQRVRETLRKAGVAG
jgi:hypothetical protein